jgi:universal stress protein E
MQRFKNILLVIDGNTWSKEAFERASMLAKRDQARLTAIDVVEELPRGVRMQVKSMLSLDLQRIVTQERSKRLKKFIASQTQKVKVRSKVLCGTPFLEIIRQVLRDRHDLVMVTAEGKSRLKEILFGRTTLHLMRKCPCPVWVMKPGSSERYARIMAAVDPDPFDPRRNALNTKIMDLATSLARREGSKLHVVHAWTAPAEAALRGGAGFMAEDVSRYVRDVWKTHTKWLDVLLKKSDVKADKHRVHLMKGEAGKVIPELAKRERIELIVMGTLSRSGVAGLLIGNTAEKVLYQVNCSVLTVKPEQFVTPVTLNGK